MSLWRVSLVVIVAACWLLVLSSGQNPTSPTRTTGTTGTASNAQPPVTNSSRPNSTLSGGGSSRPDGVQLHDPWKADASMIKRALYVLIGITIIAVLYFLIRAVRLKKPAQRKKYGLLSNYDDSVEMEAVDSDGDDTLYEARSLRR